MVRVRFTDLLFRHLILANAVGMLEYERRAAFGVGLRDYLRGAGLSPVIPILLWVDTFNKPVKK